jgi:hypothetical protein
MKYLDMKISRIWRISFWSPFTKGKKPLFCTLSPIVGSSLLVSNGHYLYGLLVKLVIDNSKRESLRQFAAQFLTNGTPEIRHI